MSILQAGKTAMSTANVSISLVEIIAVCHSICTLRSARVSKAACASVVKGNTHKVTMHL